MRSNLIYILISEYMRLLFFEPKLCIKTYKYSLALSRLGHTIDMAYVSGKFDLNYKLNDKYVRSFNPVKNAKDIIGLVKQNKYHYVICKDINPTVRDLLIDISIRDRVVLLIGDIHMIRTTSIDRIRLEKDVFGLISANRVIFSGTFIKNEVTKIIGPKFTKSVVVPNVPVAIPGGIIQHPKLSSGSRGDGWDNKIHLVYCGCLQNDQGHRNFNTIFANILKHCPDVILHVLPTKYKVGVDGLNMKNDPRLVIHDSIPNEKLHSYLTQFDIGLCLFDMSFQDRDYIHISEANKFYDYLFAGIPQITNDSRSYRYLIDLYKCGETLGNVDSNFSTVLNRVKEIKVVIDVDKECLDSRLKDLQLFK